jgi:PAS domain S-box-containing protein
MDSAPDGLICVARDISSQMKIQESLVKSEERFRSMIEYGSDVITIIGLDGTIYYESPSVERVLGYRPEEVIGKNAFEFLHPDDMPAIISGINRLMENDSIAISSDLSIMSAAGDYKVVEATGVNQIKNPAVNGIIITYRDVTEHRRSIQKLTESEERYRTLVEMANDGIAIIKNGNIVYANRGFNTITGFSQEEMKNQPIFSFMFEDDISRLIELRREHKKRPAAPSIFESSLKDRNGSRVHVEVNVSSIPYGGGRADMVVFRDISKRKLAEAKLFESEKRYRMLAENMSDVVWIMDIRSLMLTYASPSVKEMLGYEVEEILQMPLSGYVAEEYIEPIMKDLAEELDRESREETAEIDPNRNRNIDIKYRHKNGTPVWAEIRAKFLRDADGHPDRIMGVSRDISARKLAEKKLRESEERLRLIIETSTDIIYVLNPEGKFTYISLRFEEVTGHPVDESLGRNFTDFLPPDQIRPLDATFESGMRQRISNIYECTMVFPNGDSIPVELNVNSICDTTGKIVGRLGVARDIRGRRETEWALRESELRYRLLAENSSDVIWTMDLSLHFTYVSPSNQVIFGYTPEETMRKNLDELLTPESYRLAVAYFKKEITLYARGLDADPFRKRTLELQQLTKDGRTLDIEVNISLINDGTGRAIGILGITRDVTARKRAENALKESEERLRLRNEVIEKDLKTAQLIQRSLISGKTLRSERLDVDVRYLPLDAVGGDYFSFTELENEGLGVFIGDVTSHGVTAALYLSLIKATTDRICRIHAP